MSHTKEPWIYELPDADHEGIIIGRRGGAVVDGEFSDDNARRIVACVNACAGIPNEVLEMDQPQFVAILKQRAELAEAIRLTLDENGHLADGDVCTLKRLKDALAKVGAGTTATEGHNVELTGSRAALLPVSPATEGSEVERRVGPLGETP